jgi:hypothetical protein
MIDMIPTKTKWTTDLSNLELLNIKMTTTKVDVNPSPGLGQTLTSYISVCPSPGLGFTSTFVVVIFMFKSSRFDRSVVHFVLVGIMSIITVYSRLSIHIDLFLSLKCRYMDSVSFFVFCYVYLVFCSGLGQTLIYDVIKQVNRIQTLPLKLKYLPAKQK